jgi:hypothetical protein
MSKETFVLIDGKLVCKTRDGEITSEYRKAHSEVHPLSSFRGYFSTSWTFPPNTTKIVNDTFLPRTHQGWRKHTKKHEIKLINEKLEQRKELRRQLEDIYYGKPDVDREIPDVKQPVEFREVPKDVVKSPAVDRALELKNILVQLDEHLILLEHQAKMRRAEEELIAILLH